MSVGLLKLSEAAMLAAGRMAMSGENLLLGKLGSALEEGRK
ncbi:MAG TPA: hypothetical protein VEM93_09440 [Actinomycetota bacterium]|nr:hypothetical protein [Actinomycetota bacterium]